MYPTLFGEQPSVHTAEAILFPASDVEALVNEYVRALRIKRRSEAHQDRVRLSLSKFVAWLHDNPEPVLNVELIEDFALWLMDEARPFEGTAREGPPGSLSVASQRGYLIDLRSFLKWCHARRHIPYPAHQWVPVPKPPRIGIKRANNEDIRRILDVARADLRDYTLCCLLIDCGLRAGELSSMRIEACDLENRSVVVNGKTGFRTVVLSKQAAEVLARWLEYRHESTGYVFPGRKDGHLSANAVYQILMRLRDEAEVKGRINPHAWRHAYISNTAIRGGNAALTQIQAGHANIATTEVYFGFSLAELREYQERVTALPDLAPIHPQEVPAPQRRLPRPSQEELLNAIRACPNWEALGRQYGVSGAAVKKWARRWGLVEEYREAKRHRRRRR